MKKTTIITLVIFIVVSIGVFLFLYIFNSRKIDVSWVKTNVKVWFINNDYHLCRIDANGQNKLCTKQKIKDRFVFSPDGNYIAFVAWDKDENDSTLYIIDTNIFSTKELISNSRNIADTMEWSADNHYLAYASEDKDTNNDESIDYLDQRSIYIVDLKNDDNILLARGAADHFNPFFWSKDGEHLYFERTKTYSDNDLRDQYIRVNVITKKQDQIIEVDTMSDHNMLDYIDNNLLHFNQENGNFVNGVSDTSSDGKKIYSERGSIFVDEKELIEFNEDYDAKFNSGYDIPQWLPDNKYIIFEGKCSQSSISRFFQKVGCIFIADSETGKFDELAEGNYAGVCQSN